jgi:hypothetical protein
VTTPSVGRPETVAEGQVDHDVRGPGEGGDEPERRQDAGRGEGEQHQRRRWVMHCVEERHRARCHLPAGMRLADTQQGRVAGPEIVGVRLTATAYCEAMRSRSASTTAKKASGLPTYGMNRLNLREVARRP